MSSLHNDLDTWANKARVSGRDRIEISNETAHEIAAYLRDHQQLYNAMQKVRDAIKNARGAIESNQVIDKDVHGTLSRAIVIINAAIRRDIDGVTP